MTPEHLDVARRITGQTGLLEGVTKCNHFVSILEAIDLTSQHVHYTNSLQGIHDDLTEDMMILYNAAACESCEQFQFIHSYMRELVK